MGEPLRIDPASCAAWESREAKRVLLLCAEQDRSVVELARPQLELQGLRVDVVTDAFDPHTVWNALAADACPTVVAVVVSGARARSAARATVDAFSEVAGRFHRLFVLDLRRRPSVLQQVRALSDAVEGLRLTLEIARDSRADLTVSATASPRASGERSFAPCAKGTWRLHVVQPPVLLGAAVYQGSQTIPATTRFPVSGSRLDRHTFETCPDLPLID
ncbi:MAG: hypothetical protein KUG77_00500 [Nannocystaceae bacterium]|nr:hypothetical protein [Nannocystaceae bacterium]